MKTHLYLIDAYSFVFRAYFSMPPLSNPAGVPVGALYGFTNMLSRIGERLEEEVREGDSRALALVAFDAGGRNFRHDIYEEYKANRPPAPEDLIPQFPLVKDAARMLGFPCACVEGYEADDIIATYARLAQERCAEHLEVTIVSVDKDLMQLVRDDDERDVHVRMYDSAKNRVIATPQVEEKFGVPPVRVLDVLALMGDSSDNIPGVPGIGPKTAAQLISEHGHLEGVLAGAEHMKKSKRRDNLREYAQQARLSYRLADLCYDVPGLEDIDALKMHPLHVDEFSAFIKEHNFRSLMPRLEKLGGDALDTPTPDASEEVAILRDKTEIEAFLGDVSTVLRLAICPHGSGVGLAAMGADGKPRAAYITDSAPLTPYITARHVRLVTHNAKDGVFCTFPARSIGRYDDVLLMGYLAYGGHEDLSLQGLARRCGVGMASLPQAAAQGDMLAEESDADSAYAASCARAMLSIYDRLTQQLQAASMLTLYENIERPLTAILRDMQQSGVPIDSRLLREMSSQFASELGAIEEQVRSRAECDFNLSSPKQLGEVLFDKLGIPGGKKGKNGAYSTGAEVLEKIAASEDHPVAADVATMVLRHRALAKLKSTYTDALPSVAGDDGRVRTCYQQAITATGRLSSRDPNLQNIPIRSVEGRQIRKAFIAANGRVLIGADYSQIELRLLAHMARILPLIDAFARGLDVHRQTASEVFSVPLQDVTDAQRYQAKAINFGIIYGQSAFGLAKALGISRTQAGAYIDSYFTKYPGIRDFMDKTMEFARKNGYVTTIMGRHCFVPDINSKNATRRSFAERAAINAPLQGSAADIIKKAMIDISRVFTNRSDAQMILQVHDELIIEVEESAADEVAKLVRRAMQSAVMLDVPLITETRIGKNWTEVH